jgi:hypothetical protein
MIFCLRTNIAFEYFVKSQSQKKITLPKEKETLSFGMHSQLTKCELQISLVTSI